MQKRLLIIVGCIVFGASLLAHLPAQIVLPDSSDKLQFNGVSGTVWRGELRQVLMSGEALPVRNLNWKVSPLKLFTGTATANFHEQQAPANHGEIRFSLLSRQLELRAMKWQLPASSLAPLLFQPWVKAEGQIVLDLQSFQLPANAVIPNRLEGRLDWQDATVRINSEFWRIGSPVVQLSNEGDHINGDVSNSQAMLPGTGSFECTTTVCRLSLDLQPTTDAPQSLLSGLSLLGLQQSGTRFSGQITLPVYYP